jgi:hypothetical protein
MNAEALATIAAAVVALTQLAKWGGLPDHTGPLAVLGFSALGVILWGYSTEPAFARAELFTYFSGWIVVATSAAGVFGFTRAGAAAVISANPNTPGLAPSPPPLVQRELEALAAAVGGQHNDIERIENAIRDLRADTRIAPPEDPDRLSTRHPAAAAWPPGGLG